MPSAARRHAIFLTVLVLAPLSAFADGDAEAGEAKAVACAGCHGPEGISTNPMWPSLAGQKEKYLAKQLRDFREGRRANPVMAPIVRGLSDEDIEDLAAYYSSL